MEIETDIYYPKDYNAIADIPSDFKKMAISIQKKLNNMSNGGNTDVTGIFFFDVTEANSATDPKRITFFQEVVDYVRTGKIAYILSYYPSDKRPIICAIPSVLAGKSNDFFNLASLISIKEAKSYSEMTLSDFGITFDLDDNYKVTRGGFLGGIRNYSFLEPEKNYSTPYEPKYLGSPVNKSYVDKKIEETLAKISGLTPKIVDELPTIEEANSNTIYLVPVENAEEPNLYNEYLFINSNFELIGQKDVVNADLSQYAKKEEVPLVYFWDGQDSTQNTDNIQFFQEILDKYLEGKDVVVISQAIHNIRMSQLYTFDKSNQNELISNSYLTVEQGNDFFQIIHSVDRIILSVTENKVSKVNKSVINSGLVKTLSLDSTSNINYFKATRKSQPVSKGQLDDVIGDINALLDEINGEVVEEVIKDGNE